MTHDIHLCKKQGIKIKLTCTLILFWFDIYALISKFSWVLIQSNEYIYLDIFPSIGVVALVLVVGVLELIMEEEVMLGMFMQVGVMVEVGRIMLPIVISQCLCYWNSRKNCMPILSHWNEYSFRKWSCWGYILIRSKVGQVQAQEERGKKIG